MVDLKEIQGILRKTSSNKDKLIYLKKLLEETNDKNLQKQIKEIIEDIKELESVAQIETRGRVEWTIPDEEQGEERTLERQVAFIPLPEEEKKEEKKIEYGLQSNTDFYQGRKVEDSGLRYEGANRRIDINEGKSFISGNESLIERRASEQFMGKDIREPGDEVISDLGRYETSNQESRGYASVSEEVHEKERKKPRW